MKIKLNLNYMRWKVKLITINNKYSINIEEYEKLNIGDEFSTQRELFRKICYPAAEKFTGTEDRTLKMIRESFIGYETTEGFKIKITSIQPTEKLIEMAENMGIGRIRYDDNRDYLLEYIIFSLNYDGDDVLYLSTTEIIKDCDIFPNFYYEYAKLYYDKLTATKDDNDKLNDFILNHGIADKDYFVKVMDKLSYILYNTVFSKDNILSWAVRNDIEAERILFKDGVELDKEDSQILEENYIKPLKDSGVHPKLLIKLANMDYVKDNGLTQKNHKWFYYKYKFVKRNEQLFIKERDLMYHQNTLNDKIIKGLKKKVGVPKDVNMKNKLDYIINSIKK